MGDEQPSVLLFVWLVRRKQHTGVKSMAHEDLARRFASGGSTTRSNGWTTIATRSKSRLRKPTSKWSDVNRRRWNELKAACVYAQSFVATPSIALSC